MYATAREAPKYFKGRLGEFLASESSDVRKAAALIAAGMGAREQIPALIKLYTTTKNAKEKESYWQALIDIRAGKELAAHIAANPDVDDTFYELMVSASDDLKPAMGLLSHDNASLRAAVIPWVGHKPKTKSEDIGDPFLHQMNAELSAREAPAPHESDGEVMLSLAMAVGDSEAAVSSAAIDRLGSFSSYETRQPTLLALLEAELAKTDSKVAAGLCYGVNWSDESEHGGDKKHCSKHGAPAITLAPDLDIIYYL